MIKAINENSLMAFNISVSSIQKTTYIILTKCIGGTAMERRYMQDKYYIAVFQSRNHALQLYQYLNRQKYSQYELISTPCKIKAGCSYSIKFTDLKDHEFLQNLANESNRNILAIYEIVRQNGRRVLNKLDLKSQI